ncbi:hypothetical protein ANANG_G00297500, partial [Anguilla anguilla]
MVKDKPTPSPRAGCDPPSSFPCEHCCPVLPLFEWHFPYQQSDGKTISLEGGGGGGVFASQVKPGSSEGGWKK